MSNLEQKKVDLEKKFEAFDATKKELVEQRRLIDQKLSQVQQEQLRLQGEFRMIEDLLKEEQPKKKAKK